MQFRNAESQITYSDGVFQFRLLYRYNEDPVVYKLQSNRWIDLKLN